MKKIVLKKVDDSGIFALPEGLTTDDIEEVFLNGEVTEYIPVKDKTEIDVPLVRADSIVIAVFRE